MHASIFLFSIFPHLYAVQCFRAAFHSTVLSPNPIYAFPAFKGSVVEVNVNKDTLNKAGVVVIPVRDYIKHVKSGMDPNFYRNWLYCTENDCTGTQGDKILYTSDTLLFQSATLDSKEALRVKFVIPKDNYYYVIVEPFYSSPFSGHFHIYSEKGELSAINAPLLGFHALLTFLYACVLGVWLYLCYVHRESILSIQRSIGVILSMSVLVETLRWLFLSHYNRYHKADYAYLVLIPFLTSGIHSFFLFTTLLIAKGQGIVVKSIKRVAMHRAAGLTLVTLISMSIAHYLDIEYIFSCFSVFYYVFSILLYVPQTVFAVWILIAFRSSIQKLRDERQRVKLNKYYQMIRCFMLLCSALWFTSAIYCYFALCKFTDAEWVTDNWKSIYIKSCWQHCIKFVFVCVYGWMWRPSGRSMLYAVEEIGSSEDFDMCRQNCLFEIGVDGMDDRDGYGGDLDEREATGAGLNDKNAVGADLDNEYAACGVKDDKSEEL